MVYTVAAMAPGNLGTVPFAVFRQPVVGVVRVLDRVRVAALVAGCLGIAGPGIAGWEIATAAYGGSHGGPTTIVAWLAGVFAVVALLAAPIVRWAATTRGAR